MTQRSYCRRKVSVQNGLFLFPAACIIFFPSFARTQRTDFSRQGGSPPRSKQRRVEPSWLVPPNANERDDSSKVWVCSTRKRGAIWILVLRVHWGKENSNENAALALAPRTNVPLVVRRLVVQRRRYYYRSWRHCSSLPSFDGPLLLHQRRPSTRLRRLQRRRRLHWAFSNWPAPQAWFA